MGGLIPIFNSGSKNDLSETHNMSVVHKTIKERADGSKEILERSMDIIQQDYRKGGQWLTNKPTSDRDEDHFRENKATVLIKQKHILDDGKGNREIDEKAIKTEDLRSMHGTKLIRSDLNILPDRRGNLLHKFISNKNPFKMLGNKQTQELLDSSSDLEPLSLEDK